MTSRRAIGLLAVGVSLAALSLYASPKASGPPPQPLHQAADGHWTPYDAPADLVAEGDVVVYTIQAGDWLSKIAQAHLGDWKLWPQIWEMNLWITDSHWIYPGDKILIPKGAGSGTDAGANAGGGSADATVDGTGGDIDSASEPLESESLAGEPRLLGSEDDIYCFGYIDEDDEDAYPYTLIASEALVGPMGHVNGDLMFMDGGKDKGVKAGDVYWVLEPREEIEHPVSGDTVGRFVARIGRVRVICVQDETATIEVASACSPVMVGMKLVPFDPIPVPIARRTPMRTLCDPVSGKPTGAIVRSRDLVLSLGDDHVVMTDLGSEAGFKPGDFLTVFALRGDDRPRAVLAELGVLEVGPHWSTAKVLESRQDLKIGLGVEGK